MVNNFQHLEFPTVFKDSAKPPRPPQGKEIAQRTLENKKDKEGRKKHSHFLSSTTVKILENRNRVLSERQQQGLPDIPTSDIPLLIQIDPDEFDPDFLYSYGFEVVSEQEDGYLLVASDQTRLNEFLVKLQKYIEVTKDGKLQKGTAKIASIYEIDDTNRVQRVLSESLYTRWPFIDTDKLMVDIGVECAGVPSQNIPSSKRKNESDRDFLQRKKEVINQLYTEWDDLKIQRESEFESFLNTYQNECEILSILEDDIEEDIPDSFTVKVKISGKALKDLILNFPYIFEVIESDQAESIDKEEFELEDVIEDINILEPLEDSPIVCVIDSGVQEKHKYLSPAIIEDSSESYLDNEGPEDLVDDGGHGTRVAGAVLYPQGLSVLENDYQLPCWIKSCKTLDKDGYIPENIFPPNVLKSIISDNYDSAKIYNHSINSRFPCRTRHMSSWAAEIDLLTYLNDVLFIQSAGNISKSRENPFCYGITQLINNGSSYPDYLLSRSCRIANPAQSMNALTVGSVNLSVFYDEITGESSLGKKDQPSAFSRTGLGIWDTIKPEVVEYGGGLAITEGDDFSLLNKEELCPELIRRSPPGPAYAKDHIGTSFAAPKVSYIAAKIQELFPDQPALLYRGLIVHSAKWPNWVESIDSSQLSNVIKQIGYGIPDINNALENNEYRITFITQDKTTITPKKAHIYKIPVPEALTDPGEEHLIKIEVTLSYAAKPRRTRMKKRGYLSSWLHWETSKLDDSMDSFKSRIFKDFDAEDNSEDGITWYIGRRSNWGKINGIARDNNTIQKDWTFMESNKIPKEFCIAVVSHPGWDKNPDSKAYYSLIVSFEAVNKDIEIYEMIKNEVEIELEQEYEF